MMSPVWTLVSSGYMKKCSYQYSKNPIFDFATLGYSKVISSLALVIFYE
jgi:hypothetical protein